MSGAAKIVGPKEQRQLLAYVSSRRYGTRNAALILLSFKAGLRACECAGLDWIMVTTASGGLADTIEIEGSIAKNGRARRLPMHPELRKALAALKAQSGSPRCGPVIRSQRGGHLTPCSIVNWFTALYTNLGLLGCSSHSGRRTFITTSARLLGRVGGSLRDVQELAGHSALTTTASYIEGDRAAQHKLVRLL